MSSEFIIHLIETYGYLALLAGTFFEGETLLIMGGFMAQQGHLELPAVILVAFIGSLSGDQLSYFLGRLWSKTLLAKLPHRFNLRAKRVFHLLERHNTLVMVGFRFVYGIRLLTPFVIAMTNIKAKRFFILNAIGAGLWSCLVAVGGYLFGTTLELVFSDIKKYELEVLGLFGLIALLIWFSSRFVWKKI